MTTLTVVPGSPALPPVASNDGIALRLDEQRESTRVCCAQERQDFGRCPTGCAAGRRPSCRPRARSARCARPRSPPGACPSTRSTSASREARSLGRGRDRVRSATLALRERGSRNALPEFLGDERHQRVEEPQTALEHVSECGARFGDHVGRHDRPAAGGLRRIGLTQLEVPVAEVVPEEAVERRCAASSMRNASSPSCGSRARRARSARESSGCRSPSAPARRSGHAKPPSSRARSASRSRSCSGSGGCPRCAWARARCACCSAGRSRA